MKLRDLTWVGWLNFLVLQWLCFRLGRERDTVGRHLRWMTVRWVLPLTGWWSHYVFVRRAGIMRRLS